MYPTFVLDATQNQKQTYIHYGRVLVMPIFMTAISSTQQYIQLAIDEHTTYPCFWLRGICPLIFTKVDTADIADTRVYARIGTIPQCGDVVVLP